MSKHLLLSICLLAFCSTSFAQPSHAPAADSSATKVLFVGNSFIYFFNLPQVVATMVESQGGAIRVKKSTVGGSNLEQHWKRERGTRTMDLLESEDWDYVVFNNHSRSAIETPERFLLYGQKFAEKVKSIGATPVFMITWGYASNPLMQKEITAGYLNLAEVSGAKVVPAGPLFEQSRHWRPDLDLFHDDKHPSAEGTYLIGLAFYQFFTGKPPHNIPGTLKTKDQYGEELSLVFIRRPDALFMQQLVREFDWSDYQ